MSTQTSFQPDWISAPGTTIKDILSNKGKSISDFAKDLNQPEQYVNNLLIGQEEITSETANQLESVLGTSAKFWLNRESIYREQVSFDYVKWTSSLPIKDMIKFGWINNSSDLVKECLSFFNVPNIQIWNKTYISVLESSRFRKSDKFDAKTGSLLSWLRYGEIQASKCRTEAWNSDLFLSKMTEIKQLSRLKSPKLFIPRLREICAECGLAIIISPTPTGCPASGAVKFVSNDKAMMLLSFRYLSDDQFWFTFFHESGHLIMDHGRKLFIEQMNDQDEDEDEKEANIFAGEALIPSPLREELRTIKRDKHSIVRFSIKAGVSPGIVIGQMQHEGLISPSYLNGYKRRYKWEDINMAIN